MRKKIVAVFLAMSMIVGALAGCAQKEQQEETTSTPAETTETEEAVEEEAKEPEEIVKVKWIARCAPQEDDEQVFEAMNELLRERYSLELEFVPIDLGEYAEKINLIITSGEDYDICYTTNWVNDLYTNVNREAFLGLDELMESEAGELLMSVYPDGLEDVARVNGTCYGIPNYQLLADYKGVFIQKELVEKYNLDVTSVKTIQDLEPFMEQIRDNEPDMWALDEKNFYTYVMEDFAGVAGVHYGDTTYTAQLVYETQESYDRHKLFNDYYHEGFIRSDVATVMDNSADLAANRYAMFFGNCNPGADAQMTAKYGKEYVMVPLSEPFVRYNAAAATMLGINVNSKNPEAAIKMIGVMWTDPEIYNMLLFGIEGEHYNKVGENRVELIADSGYDRSSFGWACGNQFNAWLLPGQADDVWEQTAELNASAEVSTLTGFVFDSASLETELAQIATVNEGIGSQFKYTDDFDAWHKEYVEKLKEAGAEKVVEELQKQIDAWREANGK